MNTVFLGFLLCLAFANVVRVAPGDRVILIHGLSRTPLSMLWLEWKLKRAGYQVENLHYPSRRFPVEQLAEQYLAVAVQGEKSSGRIHFVTHSLGGIVVRDYLANHALTNLGRVVMLAPPNHGSELADILKKSALGRWILGPAGCQLGTGVSELPERLGPAHFSLGIIASDGSRHPLFRHLFPGPNDGKVSVQSTQLSGMTDFLVVPGSHTWIIWRKETARQVLTFLDTGRFTPAQAHE